MNQIINSCVTALNSIGRGFCDYTADMFVQSSVLIILLLLIDFLLRMRVRAMFRYCVWMLVFVKLILPPTLSLPTGIGYWSGDYLSVDWTVLQQVSKMVRPEHIMALAPEDFALADEFPQAQPSQTNLENDVPVKFAVSGLETLAWQAVVDLSRPKGTEADRRPLLTESVLWWENERWDALERKSWIIRRNLWRNLF